MDRLNPYSAPNAPTTPAACAAQPPTSLAMALRCGARLGWKWGNYVAAAHVVFFILFGAGLVMWMHAAGNRIHAPTIEQIGFAILIAMVGYVELCVWGTVLAAYFAARNYRQARIPASIDLRRASPGRTRRPPSARRPANGPPIVARECGLALSAPPDMKIR